MTMIIFILVFLMMVCLVRNTNASSCNPKQRMIEWVEDCNRDNIGDGCIEFVGLVDFPGVGKITREWFESIMVFYRFQFELEHVAMLDGDNKTITVWKEYHTWVDGVNMVTREVTIATFDMEKCMPFGWDQIFDTVQDNAVWAKMAEVKASGATWENTGAKEDL